MCVDIQSGVCHLFNELFAALEVGGQALHQNLGGTSLQFTNSLTDVTSTEVVHIITIDAGEDDVAEAPVSNGLSDMDGLLDNRPHHQKCTLGSTGLG